MLEGNSNKSCRPAGDIGLRTAKKLGATLKSEIRGADFLPDPESLKREIKKPVTLRLDPSPPRKAGG